MGRHRRRSETLDKLDYAFSPDHTDPQDFERTSCKFNCLWWDCKHCEHEQMRDVCMTCNDVFYDITE